MYDQPYIQKSDPYQNKNTVTTITRTIYYGEVISIDDPTDGGRIMVKIPDFDNKTDNADLPWCYPIMPRFIHIFPKVGEMVRIWIEDIKYPLRSRFWEGSIISQQQKINFDSSFTALSTTNMALTDPDKNVNSFPNAVGVYPLMEDIAIVGRVNTDVILRINEVHIRAGKHENGDVLTLNVKNPATIDLAFEPNQTDNTYYSNTIIMSDKIALIAHEGNPKFKAAQLTPTDRFNIFNNAHPVARADVLVQALNIIRNVIIGHIHPYSNLPADKEALIKALEDINFDAILQKNIVVN